MGDRNKRSDPPLKVSDFPSQHTIIYNLNKNNNAEEKIRYHTAKQQMSHSVGGTNWYFILSAMQKVLEVPPELQNISVTLSRVSVQRLSLKRKKKKTTLRHLNKTKIKKRRKGQDFPQCSTLILPTLL